MCNELTTQTNKVGNTHYIVDGSSALFDYAFDELNNACVSNNTITIASGTKTNVVINLHGNSNNYHNGVFRIHVQDGANANMTIIANIGNTSADFTMFDVVVDSNAILNMCIVNVSSKYSVINYNSKIVGNNSTNNLYSIYLGNNACVLDINYNIVVCGTNSKADIQVVGALQNNSTKHFKGTIDFVKGCVNSCGSETEECLMLDNTCHSIALPMILCGEESVDGKHATSVGKIDEKIMFYLNSRGLTPAQATTLVVKAHFSKILSYVSDKQIVSTITDLINKELSYED